VTITLESVTHINTSDVLYDTKLKQFCIYPQGITNFDEDYIKNNCLRLPLPN